MTYKAQIITSLSEISEDEWNACSFNNKTYHNPFLSYQFLSALEDSRCAVRETGWYGQHIIIRKDKTVIGVMPLYLKNHSQGEYVFDHAWANALHSAGGEYYPKLQCSIPFSPVTTSKLLVHPSIDATPIRQQLIKAALSRVKEFNLSSLHITFAEHDEWALLAESGFLQRMDQQFHWVNKEYKSFDDFLMKLSSRKRKNIRKERKQAISNGITIEILSGQDITEAHWDDYFSFYLDTANRKWGQPYLNRHFFSLLGERLSDHIVLIMCKRNGRYIAGALNLSSDNTLYGRYWGAIEDHRSLHFEVCYYQAIEYAIKQGLQTVEAGAQGEHKLARGYLPTTTYSAHWISNPSFRHAVADYLKQEREAVLNEQELLASFAPFKKEIS